MREGRRRSRQLLLAPGACVALAVRQRARACHPRPGGAPGPPGSRPQAHVPPAPPAPPAPDPHLLERWEARVLHHGAGGDAERVGGAEQVGGDGGAPRLLLGQRGLHDEALPTAAAAAPRAGVLLEDREQESGRGAGPGFGARSEVRLPGGSLPKRALHGGGGTVTREGTGCDAGLSPGHQVWPCPSADRKPGPGESRRGSGGSSAGRSTRKPRCSRRATERQAPLKRQGATAL